MLSELSRPSLRIHFTFNLMIQEAIQSFCCYQAARRKGKFMTCHNFFAQNMHDQLAGSTSKIAYHEYIGGCSVHRRDTMSTLGGYHEYIGGIP